jgi:hypothetical protein
LSQGWFIEKRIQEVDIISHCLNPFSDGSKYIRMETCENFLWEFLAIPLLFPLGQKNMKFSARRYSLSFGFKANE